MFRRRYIQLNKGRIQDFRIVEGAEGVTFGGGPELIGPQARNPRRGGSGGGFLRKK